MTPTPTRVRSALVLGVLGALVLGLPAAPATAATAAAPPAPTANGHWADLEADATRDGSVPVIVRMRVSTKPEHTLSDADRGKQRDSVRAIRAAVLGELGTPPARLKEADDMPLVAFSATVQDLRKLQRSPKVEAVTEDEAHQLDVQQSANGKPDAATPETATPPAEGGVAGTTSNGSASALPNWWDRSRIGVPTALNAGWNGTGQHVAVLDTGVDRYHSWINGRVVNETCFSALAHCPNGTTRQYGTGAAAPCTYHSLCAHGTHVAHTAAGYWGVAPSSRILAVQVFSRNASTGRPTYYDSDLVWGLSHVYNVRTSYRIAAVNLSVGGALYNGYCNNTSDGSVNATYLTDWMNALKSVGIATVVSSGNNNSATALSRPACISTAISVGNTTLTTSNADAVFGYVTGGSNSNATLDLLAPGTDICSAVPTRFNSSGVDCSYIGTSMAAPHVTGTIAVMRQKRPGATVDQLLNALYGSGPGVVDSRNNINRARIHVVGALNRI